MPTNQTPAEVARKAALAITRAYDEHMDPHRRPALVRAIASALTTAAAAAREAALEEAEERIVAAELAEWPHESEDWARGLRDGMEAAIEAVSANPGMYLVYPLKKGGTDA